MKPAFVKPRATIKNVIFASLLLLNSTTQAQSHFMVQGRLANNEGIPIGVPTALKWQLYRDGDPANESGIVVNAETGFITPVNALGVFTYELGTGTPVVGSLDMSVYATTAPLYALLLVEGSALLPKLKVTPVPRAHVATMAESVAANTVDIAGPQNAAVTGPKLAAGSVSGSHIDNAAHLTVDRIGLGGAPATSLDLSAKTDAVRLPTGTIAQRPATPANGDTRYNTETNLLESYVNGGWQSLSTNAGTVTSVTASTPLASSGGTTPVLSIPPADGATGGYLASGDWTTFNTKLAPALSAGQVFVGNNSNIATGVPMSGDATMSSAGALTLVSTGTAGTYAKVTTDDKGRVTSGAALDAADIPNLDAAKITSGTFDPARIPAGSNGSDRLPLAGGTMTGAIDMAGNNITNAGTVVWKVVSPAGGITDTYNAANAVEYAAKDSGTNRSINAAGTINASGADFAEWVDWEGPQPEMGSIVKYRGAYVVVSSPATAAFVGNDVKDPRHAILVAFAGQLPVWVKGAVREGDLIVANGGGGAGDRPRRGHPGRRAKSGGHGLGIVGQHRLKTD